MIAVGTGEVEMLRYLVEVGASTVITANNGVTPVKKLLLQRASRSNVRGLISGGADMRECAAL